MEICTFPLELLTGLDYQEYQNLFGFAWSFCAIRIVSKAIRAVTFYRLDFERNFQNLSKAFLLKFNNVTNIYYSIYRY